MFDFTGFYVLMGIGLLMAGVVGLMKLGLWFWLITNIFGHQPRLPETVPVETPAKRLKAWLGVLATCLGIVSTTVGLVKNCGPEKSERPTYQERYDDGYGRDVQPVYNEVGTTCCTNYGNCLLFMGANVGSPCTCMDLMGNAAGGTVCR